MTPTLSVAGRLAVARLTDRSGRASLDAFAVAAFTVSSWLTFVVASGTWMFFTRMHEPPPGLLGIEAPPGYVTVLGESYLTLAIVSCALLLFPVLGLGGAAARLGAGGRSRRLASLRLIGMTGGQVVVAAIAEAIAQALLGIVLGAALWGASLPLLTLLTFQNTPIGLTELLLPWWLWLTLILTLLVLAAISTITGLTRVRITPLGVARRTSTPGLHAIRVAALVVGLGAMAVVGSALQVTTAGLLGMLVFGGMIAVGVAGLNLFAPWLLQLLARLAARRASLPRLLAARRIAADPKGAWRNVSALAMVGVVAGAVCGFPMNADTFADLPPMYKMMFTDIRVGALITLAVAVIVGATSTLTAQGADVIDRADEARALDKMGVPSSLDAAVRRHQVLLPLLITLAISIGMGLLVSMPFVTQLPRMDLANGPVLLVGAAAVAVALTMLAAEATRSLRRTVLTTQVRRND